MTTELVWWDIRKNGQQYICTLSDRRALATVGAHAAHGPFVTFPFEIHGLATAEEITWAERQLDIQFASLEAEEQVREEIEAAQ